MWNMTGLKELPYTLAYWIRILMLFLIKIEEVSMVSVLKFKVY
jgi:hypothetical protein